jgi:hypothetical protein
MVTVSVYVVDNVMWDLMLVALAGYMVAQLFLFVLKRLPILGL